MKRIALIIDPGTGCEEALAVTCALAVRHRAGIVAVPGFFLSRLMTGEARSAIERRQREESIAGWLVRVRSAFVQQGINYEISSSSSMSLRAAMPVLQSADLVIAGRISSPGAFSRRLFRCLEQCQTPIHLAGDPSRKMEQVVVAWDGSIESMRALKSHIYLQQPFKMSYTLVSAATAPKDLPSWSPAESLLSSHRLSFSTVGAPLEGAMLLEKICDRIKPYELVLGCRGPNILKNKTFGKIIAYLLAHNDTALYVTQ